jgi:cob(I)alamin adenosyltransferase
VFVDHGLLRLGEAEKVVTLFRDSYNIPLAGRDATPGLVDVADTVTEMRKVKHAYDEGIKALKGIEY